MGKGRGRESELTYVRRKVRASSQAVSIAWRFWTKRAKRTVVTTQLLRGRFSSFFSLQGVEWIGAIRNPAHEHQDQSNLFFTSEPQLVHHG